MKKLMLFRLMSNEFFMNHSLTMCKYFYKVFGVRFTNVAVNAAVGGHFTSGETLRELKADLALHDKRSIRALSGYVGEGLEVMDQKRV